MVMNCTRTCSMSRNDLVMVQLHPELERDSITAFIG
jgi:hypothetical protein